MPRITLLDAVERWQRTERAPANAYDWYRRDAHRSGTVSLGGLTMPVVKVGRSWLVEEGDVGRAIEAHYERVAEVRAATTDLDAGILRGRDGGQIETDWGHYTRRDPFHFRWSAYEGGRRRSDGAWYCNTCMTPAATEHNNPECHRCSDWGDCQTDCTLSRVFCPACGSGFVVG